MFRIVHKTDLPSLIEGWQRQAVVYAPVHDGGIPEFQRLDGGTEAALYVSGNPRYPLKSLFLPQSEPMFSAHGTNLEPVPLTAEPRVVLNVRACDARATQLLDGVFGQAEAPDPSWVGARARTTLVGLGCTQPSATCFCTAVGSGPFDTRGVDAMLTDLGDAYLADVQSDKGAALFDTARQASREEIDAARRLQEAAASGMDVPFEPTGIGDVLYDLFDTSFWYDVQQSCLGCGVCTYLCPTCHCFDIVDEVQRRQRVRNWDTCMFRIYSQEASGYNPRPTNVERTRQRIMHKYAYFPENHGAIGCTGCGRCVRHCPVDLDIRTVIQRAQAWEVEQT
jgi:sulfhydrogenase subunit beta (sulfur reductase)